MTTRRLQKALKVGDLAAATRAKQRLDLKAGDAPSREDLWSSATWDAPQSGRDAYAVLDWVAQHLPEILPKGGEAWAAVPPLFNNGDPRAVSWLVAHGHLDTPCPWTFGDWRRVRAHLVRAGRVAPDDVWTWLLGHPDFRTQVDPPADPWLLSLMGAFDLASPSWMQKLNRALEASFRLTWGATLTGPHLEQPNAWCAFATAYAALHANDEFDGGMDDLEPDEWEASVRQAWSTLVQAAATQGVPETVLVDSVLDQVTGTPLAPYLNARQRELNGMQTAPKMARSSRPRT